MTKKFEHEHSGHYWKRKLVKEKEIKGWVKKQDGDILIQGNGTERPSDPKRGIQDLLAKLKRLMKSGQEVRIKVETFEWSEEEETTDFDPFKYM